MNTININGIDLTLGLMWTRILGDKPKKAIAEASNNLSSRFGVVRKSSENIHIGLIDDEQSNKTFSAAALVAEIVSDCVLVEKIGDDRYWICCVIDGEIIPGSDEVSNSDRMSSMVDEFSNLPSLDGETAMIYASEEVCFEIGIKANYNQSLEDILEEYGDYKNKLNLTKIIRLNSNFKKIIIGFCAVAVAVSGLGINYWLNVVEQKREIEAYNLMLKNKSASESKKVFVTDDIILLKAYNEEVILIDQKFNTQSLHYALPAYIEIIKKRVRSSELGGWKINNIGLRFGSRGEAKVRGSLSNIGEGTYQSLINFIDADKHSISGDGIDAFTNYELKKNDVIFDRHYEDYIKDSKGIRTELMDELLYIKVKFELEARKNELRYENITGLPKGDVRVDQKVAKHTSRGFNVQGEGLNLLEALSNILSNEKYSNMILNKVLTKISSDDNFTWSLSGEIYEN